MSIITASFIAGAVCTFLYGIVVGSFLNVCIYRLPREESLLHPPSHCPNCQRRLRPKDLVPLFSFLALRGRCRDCGTRISWRYFIIELTTGLLFTAFWWSLAVRYDQSWTVPGVVLLVAACLWAAAMLVTFVIDLETTYVIEPVTWLAMAAGIVFELADRWVNVQPVAAHLGALTIPYVPDAVIGMVVGFLVFIGLDLLGRLIFRKPSMGLGDAYIGAAIGALLGPGPALLSFGMAIGLGAIVGVVLIIVGRLAPAPAPGTPVSTSEGALQETEDDEASQGRYMPFGPFLTASAVLVALAPTSIMQGAAQLWTWWIRSNPW